MALAFTGLSFFTYALTVRPRIFTLQIGTYSLALVASELRVLARLCRRLVPNALRWPIVPLTLHYLVVERSALYGWVLTLSSRPENHEGESGMRAVSFIKDRLGIPLNTTCLHLNLRRPYLDYLDL